MGWNEKETWLDFCACSKITDRSKTKTRCQTHIVDTEASASTIDRTRRSIAGLKLRDVAQRHLIYLYLQVWLSSPTSSFARHEETTGTLSLTWKSFASLLPPHPLTFPSRRRRQRFPPSPGTRLRRRYWKRVTNDYWPRCV